jgi:hypothetical protein
LQLVLFFNNLAREIKVLSDAIDEIDEPTVNEYRISLQAFTEQQTNASVQFLGQESEKLDGLDEEVQNWLFTVPVVLKKCIHSKICLSNRLQPYIPHPHHSEGL